MPDTISLRKLNFSPAIITPTVWQPKERKVTIAEDAARRNEAINNQIAREANYQKQFGAFRELLNPAEDEWLRNKYNQHQEQLDAMVSIGDYNKAMQYSTQQVGALLNDPGMQARIKANVEYKEFVKNIQNSNKYTQPVKDWVIAMNPYHYEDKLDSNGNVIGGTEWKPSISPVEEVSLAAIGETALRWAKPKTGSINDVKFVDKDGNLTSTYSPDVEGIAWQTNGTWQRRGEEELRTALKAAIEMTPGAKESLDQDYKVAKWQYNQLPEDQKESMVGTDIIADNGEMLTREQYFQKRIAPWLTANQINESTSHTTYGNGIARAAEIRAQKAGQAYSAIEGLVGNTQFYGGGIPITYDNTDDYIAAKGEVDEAIADIRRAMPSLVKTRSFNEYVKNNDYQGLINYINTAKTDDGSLYKDIINSYNKNLTSRAIDKLNDNKEWIAGIKRKSSKSDLDAIDTQAAVADGRELPANQYSIALNKAFQKLNNGDAANAASFGIRFTRYSDIEDMLKSMNMSREALSSQGIQLIEKDDHDIEMRMDVNNPNKFKYLGYLYNNASSLDSFWRTMIPGFRSTQLVMYDNDGRPFSTQSLKQQAGVYGFYKDAPNAYRNTPLKGIGNTINLVNHTREQAANDPIKGTRHTNTLTFFDIPEVQESLKAFGESSAEYNRAKENIIKELKNSIPFINSAQGRIFTVDENTNTLTENLGQQNKAALLDDVSSILADDADRVEVKLGTDGMLVGYYISVTPKDDSKRKLPYAVIEKPTKFFLVADGKSLTSNRMERFKNDSGTRAIKLYHKHKMGNVPYKDSFGRVIQPLVDGSGNGYGMIDGKPTDMVSTQKAIESDILIRDMSTDPNIKDALSTIDVIAAQAPSAERDAKLQNVKSALIEYAGNAAAGILANAGVLPPDPNNPDNPINAQYRVLLNQYANKIIEKAQ